MDNFFINNYSTCKGIAQQLLLDMHKVVVIVLAYSTLIHCFREIHGQFLLFRYLVVRRGHNQENQVFSVPLRRSLWRVNGEYCSNILSLRYIQQTTQFIVAAKIVIQVQYYYQYMNQTHLVLYWRERGRKSKWYTFQIFNRETPT